MSGRSTRTRTCTTNTTSTGTTLHGTGASPTPTNTFIFRWCIRTRIIQTFTTATDISGCEYLSARSGGEQLLHHRTVAPGARELQRGLSAAIRELRVRPGAQQGRDRSLMARPAVAEHDGLDERSPVQVV